jgi:hypothetical protein
MRRQIGPRPVVSIERGEHVRDWRAYVAWGPGDREPCCTRRHRSAVAAVSCARKILGDAVPTIDW